MLSIECVVFFLGDQTSVYWLIFVWMSRLMMTSLLKKCFIEDKVLENQRVFNWLIIQVSDCFWRRWWFNFIISLIHTHTLCSMFDHGNWTKSSKERNFEKKKDKRGNISSYVQVLKRKIELRGTDITYSIYVLTHFKCRVVKSWS